MKRWNDKLKNFIRLLGKNAKENGQDKKLEKPGFEPHGSKAASYRKYVHRYSDPSKSVANVQTSVVRSGTPRVSNNSTVKPHNNSRTTVLPQFDPRINRAGKLITPEWIEAGAGLQHPDNLGGESRPMTVRMGVDFGTAFTKVAIRAGGNPNLVHVDWSGVIDYGSPTESLVMPGKVVRTPAGEYCWRQSSDSDIRTNFKLPLVENPNFDECPVDTLAYLALVIRYARAFLYQRSDLGPTLVNRSLRWELNIGCPTRPHEDPEIVDLLRQVAHTAWRLASEDDLQEEAIISAWELDCSTQTDSGLEAGPEVIPEFVAQIAGYLRSSQMREGLHALVDVGAATLDVATFNVVSSIDEQDSVLRIPIFFSAVRHFGTHFLNKHRHTMLGVESVWDDNEPVESAASFSKRNNIPRSDVEKVDTKFLNNVSSCIMNVIHDTATNLRGDPQSSAWQDGLPIFITGGGSNFGLYDRAVRIAESELKRRLNSPPRFSFDELNLPGDNNGRMTVAIGLTNDAATIAVVVPHSKIEKLERGSIELPSHEDIYDD